MKYVAAIASLLLAASHTPALAQITSAPDGANTGVNQAGNTFNIMGGTQAGSNLFHSLQQFGLNAGQIANFLSNPAISNILGRVTGGDASIINGQIQVTGSNANLYLMNPAGVVFGANASLNVPGSFTATTANGIGIGGNWFNAVGNNDYAALVGTPNSFAFLGTQPGAIVNAGNLAVGTGQSLTLLGGTVINTGTLTAPDGTITIAAVPGEKLVRVTQDGSLLSLDLPVATKAVLNPTTLTPLSLPALLTGSNLGNATGVSVDANGVVRLTSSNTAIPSQAGTAIAGNQLNAAGVAGGTVAILGQKVGLVGATIDASGTNGGGTVLIGGDYQGKGTVLNAQHTYVSPDSVIRVDAVQTGNGGRAIVWADDTTQFYGTISARGGLQSGNGGFVEVSGKQNLTFDGGVNVQAPTGVAGQLLLDPASVVTGANGAANNQLDGDREILASDPGGTFFISADRIVQALSTGNVAIAATTNIDINTEINASGNLIPSILTFTAPEINLGASVTTARGNIIFDGAVRVTSSPSIVVSTNGGTGDITFTSTIDNLGLTPYPLTLNAGGNIIIQGNIGSTSAPGAITITAGGNIIAQNTTGIPTDISTSRTFLPISAVPAPVELVAGGNIVVGNIDTDGFGNSSYVRLVSGGDIQLNTIDTGAGGIDITAGGSFRAVGSLTEGFGGGDGIINDPALIDYLVGQGFDRTQLLNATPDGFPLTSPGVRIFGGNLLLSLISRPSDVPAGQLKSPIVIRYGDQKETLVDRTYNIDGFVSRFTILGGSQQPFRMGPVFDENLQFIPSSAYPLSAYNPVTNNFAFTFNTSRALIYGTNEFPANASGLAAGVATGEGTDSSLYGAFQNRVFDPVPKPVDPVINNPDATNITNSETPNTQSSTATATRVQTGDTGQVIQRRVDDQAQNACQPATTIASSTPSETRSLNTSGNPCTTANDEAQILKILGEDSEQRKEVK
ncbi:filamentous hemagglutinin N-terminal domain-containing protein [Phormidium sp. CLA17]|uniref:two-partner secretion domain-containing protein n=1 Tax=Leptolyngbya sp. Cla-17 TaxID=2803751 RepID=UPI0014929330|nr:filamentous hemagglutinin N-terminal domain-containing protein [Leptolyngbya sp. Cla-17]MBM0743472.1 filamentous hemagglutinin N-terminal domain-containing protein [Leptolyngbya sp. Cla-17]